MTRSVPRRLCVLVLGAILLAAAAGCGGGGEQPRDRSVSLGGDGQPVIRIVSPKHGAVVRGGSKKQVPISVKVTGLDLVDRMGKKAKKGQGHIVFYRIESPDAKLPTKKGETALKGGDGIFTSYPTAKTTYAWPFMPSEEYPAGVYIFAVQLVHNDNTPLSPPQIALVAVDVKK
jgi:hypothetical protein